MPPVEAQRKLTGNGGGAGGGGASARGARAEEHVEQQQQERAGGRRRHHHRCAEAVGGVSGALAIGGWAVFGCGIFLLADMLALCGRFSPVV